MPTFKFPSPAAKLEYWMAHKPEGAPAEPVDDLIDYIESSLPGEKWENFVVRISAVRGNYTRASDLCSAIYNPSKFRLLSDSDSEGTKTDFDELLAEAANHWKGNPNIGLDVWLRWCQLAPIFHFAPTTTDERSVDFAWSRMRCFLAGAGFEANKAIASELCESYSACPLDENETKQVWEEKLLAAHAACGWPAQLAFLSWSKLVRILGTCDEAPQSWLRMLALLHILKHARVSTTQGVVVHFAGISTVITNEKSNAIGSWGMGRVNFLGALGCRPPGGKGKTPVTGVALSSIVAHVDINHLLRKQSLAAMPANYLAGPWTMPVPDHSSFDGFYQTGLRLSGAWCAEDGVVRKSPLTQHDTVYYDWNCLNPASMSESRELFMLGLPKTYEEAWPSKVFQDAFPNLDLSWCPGDRLREAAMSLLDVPVAASLIRNKCPELLGEFPAIVFMPANPSPNDSTNQGKSQAALTYARATNPSITKLMSINDSSSAPDIRTIAGEMRTAGAVAVDEFRPPKNQTHILAHDNMQALCTGSSVASGRVYENEGTVSLRSSLVFSAKVYEVPPDIQNRSLAHWLGPLTDEMRTRTSILESIRTGALSLRMRLGMHAVLEKTKLYETYKTTGRQSSSRGLRFDSHRTLAACMLSQRSGIKLEEAYKDLDKVTELMHDRMRNHVQMSVDTGLVAAMEFGTALKLRVNYLFDDMTLDEFNRFHQQLKAITAGKEHGCVAKDILLAWGYIHNLEHAPFQNYLQVLTGTKRHVSNRAVTMALNSNLLENVPVEGAKWFIPGELGSLHGWTIQRSKGDHVRFVCVHPTAQGK